MTTRPHDAVHPLPAVYADKDACCMEVGDAGMTIREHMATQIMAGFGLFTQEIARAIADVGRAENLLAHEILARMAVERADALIVALNGKAGDGG